MNQPPTAPDPQRPLDVETRGSALVLTARKGFEHCSPHIDWVRQITHSCPGPYTALQVDLRHLPMLSSDFVAGLLALLDHYRNDELRMVTLYHASDRINRTLEMMNMRGSFLIRQGAPVAGDTRS